MDSVPEIPDIVGRASLISIKKSRKLQDEIKDEYQPNDAFYLGHLVCLLFGLLNMMPLSFFITANDYWMYKFRDTSKDTVDLNDKTTLEKYFTSGSMVVQTVPSIITMLLSTRFGHKFSVKSRFIVCLTLINTIFVAFTILIKVNTDTWQLGFFVLTLCGLSALMGITNLFQVTSMAMVPKFPTQYMKTFLWGQGMAAIFSSSLQIACLALGSSTETAALMYFCAGCALIFLSFLAYLRVQSTEFYKHYMAVELENKKKEAPSKEEVKKTFIQIWPALAIFVIMFLTIVHPSITSLVVSENYGNGNKWNDVYFVPSITFLFNELCSQVGRTFSKAIITFFLWLGWNLWFRSKIPEESSTNQVANISPDVRFANQVSILKTRLQVPLKMLVFSSFEDANLVSETYIGRSRSDLRKNGVWVVGFMFLRSVTLAPLLALCNAQPRNNLPVLLPHDWQYILVLSVFAITGGYIINAVTLSIPNLADNEDVAYLILLSVIGVVAGMLTPLSLLVVRII